LFTYLHLMRLKDVKTERQCRVILYQINLEEDFICQGCNNNVFYIAKNFDKVCKKCKKRRSVTKDTIFENLRFGLLTAFKIILNYQTEYKNPTIYFSNKYGISYKTAYSFTLKLHFKKEYMENLLKSNYLTEKQLLKEIKDVENLNSVTSNELRKLEKLNKSLGYE
jgi:hypothetical protein